MWQLFVLDMIPCQDLPTAIVEERVSIVFVYVTCTGLEIHAQLVWVLWNFIEISVTCAGNNCSDHGTCYSNTEIPTCNCDADWTGVECSEKVSDSDSNLVWFLTDDNWQCQGSTNTIYIATAVAAVVVVLATITVGVLVIRWTRRKTRKTLADMQVEIDNRGSLSRSNSSLMHKSSEGFDSANWT